MQAGIYHWNLSEETKKKISEARKAFFARLSPEERKELVKKRNYKETPQEVKNKISKTLKQRWKNLPEEVKAAKRAKYDRKGEKNNMFGKHHTEESRRKMSENKRCNKKIRETIFIDEFGNESIVKNQDVEKML